MNHAINPRGIIAYSPLCLLVFLVLTVFASPVSAQVFDSGPSDSAMFDTVINVPPAPDIVGLGEVIGGDGLTTQLNVSDGGSVDSLFRANSGAEVNLSSGGSIGSFFDANSGSEVNISGGSVGTGFDAASDSEVNISGGLIGNFFAGSGSEVNIRGGSFGTGFLDHFLAASGSAVNLVGTAFVLDGVVLSDSLPVEEAFTIVDRDVTLAGRLADGTAFSFNLTSSPPVFESDDDYFDPDATLTVKLQDVLLGDGDRDGTLTFLDIDWFIGALTSDSYLAEADINQDGEVNFFDIAPFIDVLRALPGN